MFLDNKEIHLFGLLMLRDQDWWSMMSETELMDWAMTKDMDEGEACLFAQKCLMLGIGIDSTVFLGKNV